jgi:hypothetical protein
VLAPVAGGPRLNWFYGVQHQRQLEPEWWRLPLEECGEWKAGLLPETNRAAVNGLITLLVWCVVVMAFLRESGAKREKRF